MGHIASDFSLVALPPGHPIHPAARLLASGTPARVGKKIGPTGSMCAPS